MSTELTEVKFGVRRIYGQSAAVVVPQTIVQLPREVGSNADPVIDDSTTGIGTPYSIDFDTLLSGISAADGANFLVIVAQYVQSYETAPAEWPVPPAPAFSPIVKGDYAPFDLELSGSGVWIPSFGFTILGLRDLTSAAIRKHQADGTRIKLTIAAAGNLA